MGNFSVWHWLTMLTVLAGAVWLVGLLFTPSKHVANEVAKSFKFRTVVYIILAFVIPLWFVTLPLFLFLAYRSYVAGSTSPPRSDAPTVDRLSSPGSAERPTSVAGEIDSLHRLVASGALTEEEFQAQKARLLGGKAASGIASGTGAQQKGAS